MESTYQMSTLPWALVLSALAAFVAWRRWAARDLAAATRWVGWALVPWALWLVGLMRVLVRVSAAVGDWAAGFVFRPATWLGVIVAVVAALLIAAGTFGARRKAGRSGAPDEIGNGKRARAPKKAAAKGEVAKGEPAVADDDMDDIEAILRKHGIE